MNINLADQLKVLRKEKNVSQEKLAAYLNVSYQAVSKWENGNAYPDIQLLPEISRFFGISIDELLQVEKLDEQALLEEYASKAETLFRNGENMETLLALWKEAYQKMPNNIQVKEFLMSTYFDTDKVKYSQEILELGMEIYNSNASMYYKGQAIREIAHTYAELGDMAKAEQWVLKTAQIQHCQEVLFSEILDGDEMVEQIAQKEIQAENRETVVREHWERAYACSSKAATVTGHKLTLPLLFGWEIQDAPSNNLRILKWFQTELKKDYFCEYRNTEWLVELQQKALDFSKK